MDRDARSHRAGRGTVITRCVGRWKAICSKKSDCFSDILRHFGDTRAPGIDAALGYPHAWAGRSNWTKLRRERGTANCGEGCAGTPCRRAVKRSTEVDPYLR